MRPPCSTPREQQLHRVCRERDSRAQPQISPGPVTLPMHRVRAAVTVEARRPGAASGFSPLLLPLLVMGGRGAAVQVGGGASGPGSIIHRILMVAPEFSARRMTHGGEGGGRWCQRWGECAGKAAGTAGRVPAPSCYPQHGSQRRSLQRPSVAVPRNNLAAKQSHVHPLLHVSDGSRERGSSQLRALPRLWGSLITLDLGPANL